MSTPDSVHFYQANGIFAMCVRRAGRCTVYVLPAGEKPLAVFTTRGLATEEARTAFVQECLVAASV